MGCLFPKGSLILQQIPGALQKAASGFKERETQSTIHPCCALSLFMFSWPNWVTWQPRFKSGQTDHFLTRESTLSPWRSLGLGKRVICNWLFFFFNLPDSLQIYLVVIFIIFYGCEYNQPCCGTQKVDSGRMN